MKIQMNLKIDDFEFYPEEIKGYYKLKDIYSVRIVEYVDGTFMPEIYKIVDWNDLCYVDESVPEEIETLEEAISWVEYYLNKQK